MKTGIKDVTARGIGWKLHRVPIANVIPNTDDAYGYFVENLTLWKTTTNKNETK